MNKRPETMQSLRNSIYLNNFTKPLATIVYYYAKKLKKTKLQMENRKKRFKRKIKNFHNTKLMQRNLSKVVSYGMQKNYAVVMIKTFGMEGI
jgi:hypothetical protein